MVGPSCGPCCVMLARRPEMPRGLGDGYLGSQGKRRPVAHVVLDLEHVSVLPQVILKLLIVLV